MTEAGKGAEEVQDILLKNVAMFQKVCDRIQFEGVSRSEFAMLHMIHNKKDERGKLTLSELAAFLEVSSPAVSRMIKTLEDKKYIVKSPSEKDRRISYVSLSPEGEALYEMCAERMRRIGDRTVEAMGREDMIQMLGLFQRFFEIWKRIGQGHKVNTGNARFFQAFFLFNNKKESGLFPDSFFG